MNADTSIAAAASNGLPVANDTAPVDLDTLYREMMVRADALPPDNAVIDSQELEAAIAAGPLPESTFKPLSNRIAKATGLDQAAILREILKARAARDKGAETRADKAKGDLAPAAKPAPLAAVLDAIAAVVERQVWCEALARWAIALWIAATYGFRTADCFPRLIFTSEMKRCGKTTGLGVVHQFACNGKMSDNISPAAMYRLIDRCTSRDAAGLTLCIDEVDSFIRSDTDHRNVINAGHRQGATVIRAVTTPDGKNWQEQEFNCYCPAALAGIGGLSDTVLDRSVIIRLQRASKGDMNGARRMRLRELAEYRRKIVPHLLTHADAIEAAIGRGAASLPTQLNDRALDNWDSLVAVADLAGGEWPGRARSAAISLSGSTDEGAGLVEKLLQDVRFICEAPARHTIEQWRAWVAAGKVGARPSKLKSWPTEIRTSDLLARLLAMGHRPWPELNRGRPITEMWLGNRLRGLGVRPGRARVPAWPFDEHGELIRGPAGVPPAQVAATKAPRLRTYAISDLREVWRRCL